MRYDVKCQNDECGARSEVKCGMVDIPTITCPVCGARATVIPTGGAGTLIPSRFRTGGIKEADIFASPEHRAKLSREHGMGAGAVLPSADLKGK